MSLLTEHQLKCDVLVAGGGPAGVPCAIAAARCGAKVILLQDRPVLGGNASSEVRMHIVGADSSGHRGKPLETETREGGIIEEIRLETCVRNPQRSASMLDLILYEKCRAEPNLTLMLNTSVVGAAVRDGKIVSATAIRQSTEDRFEISASVFVDCTGDGRLGAEACAPFRRGREGKDEFDESLAQPQADKFSLGSTLLFQARKHDKPMPFIAPLWVRKFTEHDLRFRHHGRPGVDRGLEYGYWWVEWGGTLDTIKDNEKIRDDLLAIMLGVWDHIKNGPPGTPPGTDPHGASHWALDWFGFLPGKRESRRFLGLHVLSERDVMESRPFGDAIAFGGWPIDTHPPLGVDAIDEHPCDQRHVPHLFDIPLRSCVSRGPSNLMFAGRNISATHIAFASTRVMATCAVMGQGVGVAAAYAALNQQQPQAIANDPIVLKSIQQRLLRDDAYLVGIRNDDWLDVARQARITASSAQLGGEAINIITGQTRAVHGPRGAAPDRANPGTHRWMSDPARGFPAWIELRWDQPIIPAVAHITFDTAMHRPLTLSHSDGYVAMMDWGKPCGDTVRDYDVLCEVRGEWRTAAQVRGNYQRSRTHRLDTSGSVSALRIAALATNGLDHARIVEVRVYENAETVFTPYLAPAVETKRDVADIRRRMELVMGELPGPAKRVPLDVRVEQEFDEADRVRRLVTFTPEPGDRCYAWLIIPKRASGGAQLPAMLCCHQTTRIGKDEPAGIGGLPNLRYAAELTKRGYVTLTPDYPGYGQYRADAYAMGYASATMKGIWNHLRAVDLLVALPEVNPDRIGVIGHSLGGHNTLFAAAFDDRLKLAVSSCGFTSFAWNDNEGRGVYGDLSDWSHAGYMPRIRETHHSKASELPWDFPDVLAAIAPRPLFINAPVRDAFRHEGVVHSVGVTRPLYARAGRPDLLAAAYPDCEHDFPPDVRERAYAFIDKHLV